MKKLITIALSLLFAVGLSGLAVAGSLDSPGAPSAGSGMYTLSQIYDYLNSGTLPPTPGPFKEPSAGPASTMKNLKENYEAMATPFPQCNATADKVASGTKFFMAFTHPVKPLRRPLLLQATPPTLLTPMVRAGMPPSRPTAT